MEGRLLLDIIIAEGATVFELLSGKNQALLVGWDAGHKDMVNQERSLGGKYVGRTPPCPGS